MRTQLLAVLLVASLPACAQHAKFRLPPQSLSTQTQTGPRFPNALILAQSEGTEELDLSSGVQAAPVPERPKNLPSQPLTREMLFRFLHAEIAAQRGNLMLAARTYIELARTTRDPRVARRATELAMTGRFSDLSAEASSTWLEIEPDSQPAKQTLIALLPSSTARASSINNPANSLGPPQLSTSSALRMNTVDAELMQPLTVLIPGTGLLSPKIRLPEPPSVAVTPKLRLPPTKCRLAPGSTA